MSAGASTPIGPTAAAEGFARRTFVDPTAPVFWVMTALVALGTAILVVQNGAEIAQDPVGATIAFVAWGLYAAIGVGVVVALQRYGRRPAVIGAAALAWGGLAATAFSSLGNPAVSELVAKLTDPETAETFAAAVGAPVMEESLKMAGIVGLALIPAVRLRGPLDGLFWGVLVGAGFQVVEHFFYTMTYLASGGSPLTGVAQMLFVRGLLLGLFTHSVYCGIEGAAVGWFVERRDLPVPRRLVGVLAALALTLGVHGTMNWLVQTQGPSPIAFAILAVPLAALIGLVVWARRSEERRLAASAPLAVDRGVMTAAEADDLVAGRRTVGRAAKRRRAAQLRYLYGAEAFGPDDGRTAALGEKIPAPAS